MEKDIQFTAQVVHGTKALDMLEALIEHILGCEESTLIYFCCIIEMTNLSG